jgi:hypothetical protein
MKRLSLLLLLVLFSCTKDPVMYDVTVSASEGGTVSPQSGSFEEGSSVTFTATPSAEYEFTKWSNGSTQNPLILTVTSDLTLQATFTKKQYELTISKEGEGTINEKVINTGKGYDSGTKVELTAVPAGEWVFAGWSGDVTSNDNPIQVTISSPKNIKAKFVKRKYPLTINIEGEGTVTEEIVNTGRTTEYDSGTTVRLTAQASEGWEFSGWSDGVTNEVRTLNILDDISLVAFFKELQVVSIRVENQIDEIAISQYHKFIVTAIKTNGSEENITSLTEIITNDDKLFKLEDNQIIGAKSGNTVVKIKFEDFEISQNIYVNYYEEVDPNEYLKTPATDASIIVPVVIITYLPLKNGMYINQDTYPIGDYGDHIYEDLSVNEVQNWVLSNDIRTKFSIEEGSRYRLYKNQDSRPYVGIKVVKQFNFYEIEKLPNPRQTVMSDGEEGWLPNYDAIFQQINLKELVEEQGVKEVWFNSKSLYIPESNMSSPITGDISNSYRENDLPIYNKTYVVYGNFIHRWYGENIHNRGHQIEAQLTYVDRINNGNDKFFWQKFVGYPEGDPQPYNRGGRVGSTHYTPNSQGDYDYDNTQNINSDINDWRPDGNGEKSIVNRDTWKFSRQLPVNLPEFTKMVKYEDLTKNNDVGGDPQGGWLIYWFQSIPGENNEIPIIINGESFSIRNWWDIFYNWDDAIKENKNLWN